MKSFFQKIKNYLEQIQTKKKVEDSYPFLLKPR